MISFTHTDLVLLLIAMGFILITARIASEFAKKMKMPEVIGELIVGVLIGPSLMGKVWPHFFSAIFPRIGGERVALDGLTSLSAIMLLFVAGLEIKFGSILKQSRIALVTSITSMTLPFLVGMAVVWMFPYFFVFEPHYRLVYSIFFGTVMAISALPVIARILIDFKLLHTRVGTIIMAAAIFDDLIGWFIFSFILSLLEREGTHVDVGYTIFMSLGFAIFMLTIGRKLIDKIMPWMQNKLSWPGGVLAISFGFCFLGAAFTEKIGLSAILGAFIMGIAFGDSANLKQKAKEIIHQFVTNIFAPLFFVSIGLKVDFVGNFNLQLVLLVLAIAISCKLFGAILGGYMGGLTKREALAVGFGLSTRGSMAIILGTLALEVHLIEEQMFVAIIVMALVTTIISGPIMRYFMQADNAIAIADDSNA